MSCVVRKGPEALWSHGDVAMEIRVFGGNLAAPVYRPSMEPWRCSHGDNLHEHVRADLQWSHGDVAMEMSNGVRVLRARPMTFNGAVAM